MKTLVAQRSRSTDDPVPSFPMALAEGPRTIDLSVVSLLARSKINRKITQSRRCGIPTEHSEQEEEEEEALSGAARAECHAKSRATRNCPLNRQAAREKWKATENRRRDRREKEKGKR